MTPNPLQALRRTFGLLALLPLSVAAAVLSGCGSSEPASQPSAGNENAQGQPKPPEAEVPSLEGRTTLITTNVEGELFHYNCYVPTTLDRKKPAVVVVNISPEGGAMPLSKEIAEKLGWVMVGLVEAKNGPGEPVYKNMVSTLDDLSKRFSVRQRGFVFAGFSGGARASFFFAKKFGERCGGIIAACAGSYGTPGDTLVPDIPIFFISGKNDFNRNEVTAEAARETKAGRVCKFVVHSGGHSWGPESTQREALLWIASKLPKDGGSS